MAFKAALLCSFALVALVQECTSLKCVTCNFDASDENPTEDEKKCLPDADHAAPAACATGFDVCTVYITWTGDGDKSYARGCAKSSEVSNGKKNACDSGSVFNNHHTLCVCDDDTTTGCNGASSVGVSAAVAVVSAVCALAWTNKSM